MSTEGKPFAYDPSYHEWPYPKLADLARALSKGERVMPPSALPARIRIVSSVFLDFLVDILPVLFANRSIDADILAEPFGDIRTTILSGPTSSENGGYDCTVLLPTFRDISHWPDPLSSEQDVQTLVAAQVAEWRTLWDAIDGPIVQFTFDPPDYAPLGPLEATARWGRVRFVRELNRGLIAAAGGRVLPVDTESLVTRIGARQWYDNRTYQMFRQPFAMTALPILADSLAAAVQARLHRGRKVLVLDLDDTLWGGVIGDDGIAGILLGADIAGGEGFSDFQRYIKALSERGVILAVCSKNHEDIAMEPFKDHDGMLLSLDDFACFVANFDDKPGNIRRISEALSIGLEHFVFVDDSPVECELVRQTLPDVSVLQLPEDAEDFAFALDRANLFPISAITAEDRQRSESYRARKALTAVPEADLDGFLAGLDGEIRFEGLADRNRQRIAQLLAKTNQFKLTSVVPDETELADRPDDVLAVRFTDRLQNYGIISVMLLKADGADMRILNWVMSCRVFNRRLEYAVMAEILALAKQAGCRRIVARYEALPKNRMIPDTLRKLGFGEADQEFALALPADEACSGWPQHHCQVKRRIAR